MLPLVGGGESEALYGDAWWGFWLNNYAPSNGKRIVLMEYTDADYSIKSGFERLGYIPSRSGHWTLYGKELWGNYEELFRSEIYANEDDWDIVYYTPAVDNYIKSNTGGGIWFCFSTSKIWSGRTKYFMMTVCITGLSESETEIYKKPLFAKTVIDSFGIDRTKYEPSFSDIPKEFLYPKTSGSKTPSKSKSFSGYCKTKYDYAYGTTNSGCGGLDKEITLNEYNRLMKNNTGKSNKTTYCKRKNGVVYENSWSGMCGLNKQITKAEYDRLKNKKKDAASKTESDTASSSSKTIYCQRHDGTVIRLHGMDSNGDCTKINGTELPLRMISKAEYDRLKDKKKDTASKPEPDTASSSDDPLEAKLEKLQRLLEKGLITEEEAAAKRAKLLEDL